jgi:hypothetical protein
MTFVLINCRPEVLEAAAIGSSRSLCVEPLEKVCSLTLVRLLGAFEGLESIAEGRRAASVGSPKHVTPLKPVFSDWWLDESGI